MHVNDCKKNIKITIMGLEPIHPDILQYFKNNNILIYDKCIRGITFVKHIKYYLKQVYKEYPNDKIIIFILCDHEFNIMSYENQIIVRASANKSLLKHNEVVLPYLWSPVYKPFEPLPKTEKPIVGFCGWNSKWRHKLLKKIQKDPRIQENFILREKFLGGDRLTEQIITDFEENMKNSHFIICQRGTGNFSMRFYETLASGRIPILVNTDMQLPLYGVVDYDSVIIMESNVQRVIEKLLWVWVNKDIVDMQRKCSEFYDKYLHYAEYPRYLHEELKLKNLAS